MRLFEFIVLRHSEAMSTVSSHTSVIASFLCFILFCFLIGSAPSVFFGNLAQLVLVKYKDIMCQMKGLNDRSF